MMASLVQILVEKVRDLAEKCRSVSGGLLQHTDRMHQRRRELEELLSGSSQEHKIMDAVDAAVASTGRAVEAMNHAAHVLDQYADQHIDGGGGGGPSDSSLGSGGQPSPSGAGPTSGGSAVSFAQRVSNARAALGRGPDRSQTNALWLTADGDWIPLSSGPGDEWNRKALRHAANLPPALRRAREVAHHVEVKLAMRMSEGETETIVIDREVCGTVGARRASASTCDKTLKWFLPAQATLVVIEHDGTKRTYHGREKSA